VSGWHGWLANAVAAGARGLAGATVRWLDCRPEPRQRVYFANHTSHLDFVVLWAALPHALRVQTRPVAAKDYWQSGLRRRLAVNIFRAILVERSAAADRDEQLQSARRSLDLLLEALESQASLIIFPEGTRGRGDEIGPFKSGLYYLWQKRPDVQFVPVYLANLNRVLPKGEVLPVPFISRVAFGPPFQPQGNETKESFLREAREAVCALQRA
jgi:1-acyl-sn-glycerol-3-phosphate acyltransferase